MKSISRSKNKQSVTQILSELNDGKPQAFERLFPIVYDELKQRARCQKFRWYNQHTLNTTALINETYLKLVDNNNLNWQCRSHFLTAAAQAMRHILIDYARKKKTQKRDAKEQVVTLEDSLDELPVTEHNLEEILSLDKALCRLEKINRRESKIVEYRVFAGMTLQETAAALGISSATVKRDWTMAMSWLMREMA